MQDDHYENDFRPKLMEHGRRNGLCGNPMFDFYSGYESIYLKRSGDKSDGCCLFYKFDRFRLVNSKTVPFYQENIPLLDRFLKKIFFSNKLLFSRSEIIVV
jgi:hypothetical protein